MKLTWGSRIGAIGAVAMVAGVLAVSPAHAAKKKKDQPTDLGASADFRSAVAAVQDRLKQGDISTADNLVSALNPATPLEDYMKSSLTLEIAVKKGDETAQGKAIVELLKNSLVPQAQQAQLNHSAGYLSFRAGATDNAVIFLTRARELGLTDPHAALLLVDAYTRQRKLVEAAAILDQVIEQQRAAGQPVPASWYERAGSLAYKRKDWDALVRYNAMKLAGSAVSAPEWRSALAAYIEGAQPDKEAQLDLYRLQAATGALASERDYQGYAMLASGQGYAAEAQTVINTGMNGGKLQSNDPVTMPLLRTVKPRAVTYLASIKALPGKADSVANGAKADQDGDKLLASGQFADAIPYYRAALEKGVTNRDRTLTRLGIALARSGDFNGAKESLSQVADKDAWGQVATFWSAWVDSRNSAQAADAGTAKPTQTAMKR